MDLLYRYTSFKYLYARDDKDYGFRNRINSNKPRKDFAFFIKPHIKCGELIPNRVSNIKVTTLRDESEEFNGIVWSLPITNKDYRWKRLSISRTAGNCIAKVNIMRNNSTFRNQLPLHWRLGNDPLPRDCHIASLRSFNHDGFAAALPFIYLGKLFYNNLITTIPSGIHDELLLLFSFENCESVYLISSLSGGIIEDNMQYLSLFFNVEYKIQIQFKSDKHDNLAEKMFKLNARSWDNVILSPTR